MAEPRHSSLWFGFEGYESPRGTLVATVVTTVTLAEPVSSVQVEHLGGSASSIIATLDGTTPTADGSGDTNKKMIEVPDGTSRSLDVRTKTVKLVSAGTPKFQIIGIR